jgi:SAM-dependent methyltransferase
VGWQETRDSIANSLDRVRLLRPAARARERYLAMRTPEGPAVGPDGLALPSARLRLLVDGRSGDAETFLQVGAQLARSVREAAALSGEPIESLDSILDFGCGCGRVARHWATLDGPQVYGCDYNAELVAWCERELPFLRASRNDLEPPTGYPDASFDLVYAFSVFTHLTEPLQRDWMAEFRRILKPGGRLVISTLGEHSRERLSAAERERFDAGQVVVQRPRMAGDNVCTAYHPRSYVTRTLMGDYADVEFLNLASSDVFLMQDAWVARRSASPS